MIQSAAEAMSDESGLLLGRRTYEDLPNYWARTSEPNPFTDVLVNSCAHCVQLDSSMDMGCKSPPEYPEIRHTES